MVSTHPAAAGWIDRWEDEIAFLYLIATFMEREKAKEKKKKIVAVPFGLSHFLCDAEHFFKVQRSAKRPVCGCEKFLPDLA